MLRSFLMFLSFNERFIPVLFCVVAPLYVLVVEDGNFECTEEAMAALNTLKEIICTPPVLPLSYINKPFYVYTDASKEVVGTALIQKEDSEKRSSIGKLKNY